MNPWLIVAFVVALVGAAAGGYQKGKSDQADAARAALETERRETGERAAAERAAWQLLVNTRALEVEQLRSDIAGDAEQYQRDLEAARAQSAPITREVIRYVRARPMDPVACALPADLLVLRNAQIRAANATAGGIAAAAGGGLPGQPQGDAAGNPDR